ncbi:MAG TPA: Glu/Leu/Phe/Val dehydrogenase dimerization domain-containing protein, partial [Pseudomonadales bacterium]
MTTEFSFTDDLGPEKVIEIYDVATGLKAILVVDNTAAGPAIGGVRMAPDVSVAECFRLGRAMTLKNAMAGLAHGGGKSVIAADPAMPAAGRSLLIKAFARAIADIRDYIPGPDMGTDERAMAEVRNLIGRAVGLPREVGGIPLDEIGATGYGLSVALEAARPFLTLNSDAPRVVVQGFGSVGQHAARFLAERGARLVGVSDSRGARAAPEGFDLSALLAHKAAGHSVAAFDAGQAIDPEALLAVPCEIWIPAARPDVIREDNAGQMQTRVVIQGANIPATQAAEAILAERGVLVIPDFVANAGGVICAAVEYHGGNQSMAMATIAERIRANVTEV